MTAQARHDTDATAPAEPRATPGTVQPPNPTAPPTSEAGQRKVIRLHHQALEMAADVEAHLRRHPRDGVLFMIDYGRALNDLGYELSKGMRLHLARQLPAPCSPDNRIYDFVKAGGKLPFELDIHVRAPVEATASEPVHGAGAVGGAGPPRGPLIASRPADRAPPSAAEVTAAAAATGASDSAAGFGVLIQLSDHLVNRALGAAYDAGLFPKQFDARLPLQWEEYQLEATARVELALQKPALDFDTHFAEGVGLTIGVTGAAELSMTLLQLLSPTHAEFQDTIRFDIRASARIVVTAEIRPAGGNQSAVFLDLRDLRDVSVDLTTADLPAELVGFLESVIVRVLRTEFASHAATPVSFKFDHDFRAGVPLAAVRSRVRPPGNNVAGTLSIGFDTIGQADPAAIDHIIPAGSHFALVTTRDFLLEQAWPVAKAKFFPGGEMHPDDGVTVRKPYLDMRDGDGGHVFFQAEVEKAVDCLPDPTATVKVKLRFTAFQDPEGVWRTRLDTIGDPDVDMDFWDQVFYTFVGGLVFGAMGIIVVTILIEVLEDVAGHKAGDLFETFNVGFREKIPGTNIVVAASTPIEPSVNSRRIYAFGDAAFLVQP